MFVKERDFYKIIKQKLGNLFKEKAGNIYLEITADKSFSNKLKSAIPKGQEIIFNFLTTKKARPDITGYIKKEHGYDFVVVEFKKNDLKLDDICQLFKYIDLFTVRFGFLISLNPIPEEIKRLISAIPQILYSGNWRQVIALASFDPKTKDFKEWYPKNPFEEDSPWQDYYSQKS